MKVYPKIVIMLFGLVYGALGVWCFLNPENVATRIGLNFATDSGRAEFQVVYGGLELGIGLFLIVSGLNAAMHRAGLLFLLVSSASLLVARVFALLQGGEFSQMIYTLLITEVVMVVLALSAYYLHRKQSDG